MEDPAKSDKMQDWTAARPVPAARPLSDFSYEQVADDLVILDGETMHYHTLNMSAALIWQQCDGIVTPSDIAERLNVPIELVESTIAQLGEAGLLEAPRTQWDSAVSRRRATKLIAAGLVGAIGLPVIKSITAPDAAAAASIGQCAFGIVGGNWLCGVCSFFGCDCEAVTGQNGVCCVCGGNGLRVAAASGPSYEAFMAAVNQAANGQKITGFDEPVYIESEPVESIDESKDTPSTTDNSTDSDSTNNQAPSEQAPPVDEPTDHPAEEPTDAPAEQAPSGDDQDVSTDDNLESVDSSADGDQTDGTTSEVKPTSEAAG